MANQISQSLDLALLIKGSQDVKVNFEANLVSVSGVDKGSYLIVMATRDYYYYRRQHIPRLHQTRFTNWSGPRGEKSFEKFQKQLKESSFDLNFGTKVENWKS